MVLHHHERFDGEGYPNRLRGSEIPRESRIIAIADSFDAMTTFRSYRQPVSPEEALEEIAKGAGRQAVFGVKANVYRSCTPTCLGGTFV